MQRHLSRHFGQRLHQKVRQGERAQKPRTTQRRWEGTFQQKRDPTRSYITGNIWKRASAVREIEHLTQLFRADGHSEQKARLAAVAEYQTKAIRNVRCRIGEQIFEAADVRGSEETLAKNLRRLQSIDRYERRMDSLKKRVFQKMKREI